MSAKSLPKDMSIRRAVLSASFDHKKRAQTMNARENMRLKKQQRDIDLFKNNIKKTYMVEKNRVQSRMQNLRKNVLTRTQSNETVSSISSTSTNSKFDAVNEVHLPKLANPTANSRKFPGELEISKSVPDIHLLCEENDHQPTHLPSITANSPLAKGRLKNENITRNAFSLSPPPYARTRSHSDLRFIEDKSVVKDVNANTECPLENNGFFLKYKEGKTVEGITVQRELLDVNSSHCGRLTSRRRSLSTGDITLAERIHCFLEGVDNSNLSTDSLENRRSHSEDEETFRD